MRELRQAELEYVAGGTDPDDGFAAGTLRDPFPNDDFRNPPSAYPDLGDTSGYDPGWNDSPGSGWDIDYGKVTVAPAEGAWSGVEGEGWIVTAPDGAKVGASTDSDGDVSGVKVTKPI